MLELREVTKVYGRAPARRVLDRLSFALVPGEYVAITGESGIGKSTLLNLIAGLDVPDSGQVLLEGRDLSRLDDRERTLIRRARMGFVFQAFHLLPHLTVEGNVALPLALNGIGGRAAAERVGELLVALGLGDRAGSYPRELSGGEMQRVSVARALAHRPALVLADEPTGNLDPDSASQVLELLRTQLRRDGATGVLVTHSQLAAATADRVLVLTQRGLAPRATGPCARPRRRRSPSGCVQASSVRCCRRPGAPRSRSWRSRSAWRLASRSTSSTVRQRMRSRWPRAVSSGSRT
jgi:putative ABC transport system ATP-binding protein